MFSMCFSIVRELTTRISAISRLAFPCAIKSHFTLALGEATKSSFGGTARRERLLMGKQCSRLLQEMSTKSGICDGGGEVLDQFLGGGKGILRLLVTPLGPIQVSEVDGDAPQQRS